MLLIALLGFYRRISKDLLAKYSVTYSATDTKGINYFYIKILHLAFLHCAGPETDHVTLAPNVGPSLKSENSTIEGGRLVKGLSLC